jgi:mono/diheme cytochrome c family protein
MKEPHILPQEAREKPDPHEAGNPVPQFVQLLVGIMLTFGMVYIGFAHVDTPSAWGDGRSRDELAGNKPAADGRADGAATYASACAACHQATGAGLPGVFPPLAGSEWVNGRDTAAAAIVLNGITGTLTVKGATYGGAMPPFKAQLSDSQIAAVLTHLRSQWGNSSPPVSAATVAKVREDTKARAAPYDGEADLAALK